MKTISHVGEVGARESVERGFAIDTTFVLFFLALELGQSFIGFTLDSVFLILTLLVIAVMPYFLPADEKPGFKNWLIGRGLITAFAIGLGLMFRQSLGVVLPDTFRFMPMTLLIVTAMLSCYIQFYGFLKLREVK
jgi:hypothetical protein